MELNHADATQAVSFRQRALMRRLLAGEGAAGVEAYVAQATLDPVLHGLTPYGSLIIVAREPDLSSPLHPRVTTGPHQVRLDIAKCAADPRLAAHVASLHALGTLRWIDLARPLLLPRHCLEAVEALRDRACVGIIDCPRFVMHDWEGVCSASAAEVLTDGIPRLDPDWALNWGTGCAPGALAALADGVRCGELSGDIVPCPALDSNGGLRAECFCLDADAYGLTLLRCAPTGGSIVYLPFGSASEA